MSKDNEQLAEQKLYLEGVIAGADSLRRDIATERINNDAQAEAYVKRIQELNKKLNNLHKILGKKRTKIKLLQRELTICQTQKQ